MTKSAAPDPEFERAERVFHEAICQLEVEGGDLVRFSEEMLVHAATFHAHVNGLTGPVGLDSAMVAIRSGIEAFHQHGRIPTGN
ncbi:MAG: hypothetical protein ACOCYW_05390 [Roseicyclus sp.]